MSARIESLTAGSSRDSVVNSILNFSQRGFGDTEMFGLLARRPELLKRTAAMFSYFLGGEGGLIDARSVDDALFAELRRHFSDDEIIELICASSLFTWAGTLNTTVHVQTGADSQYGGNLTYASEGVRAEA